jgi:hypothetical protein
MITNDYESSTWLNSVLCPGVSYRVERMSFGRRIDLMKTIREATAKSEFHDAVGDDGKMATAILSAEVDRLYIRWGLKEVVGLLIDGIPATPESLLLKGPEKLLQEALASVRSESGLTEAEKKT